MLRLISALLIDRTAATAVVAAVALPALTLTAGAGIDVSLIESDLGHLQAAADAGSTAGRQYLDPFQPSGQAAPVTNAMLYANQNYASSLAAGDVVQGWWDVTAGSFGPPTAGQTTPQTGNYFSNAIQVTTRNNHNLIFGALLGKPSIALSRQSVAYKCSNTDYPLTLIPDDPSPPSLPAIYYAFSSPGNPSNQTSYYYANPNDGKLNPVIKFWVPWDGIDVSFVMFNSDGSQLQVDSYCRGTFLVVPDGFDYTGLSNDVVGNTYRGNTNNSFSIYSNQSLYPFANAQGQQMINPTTTYYHQNMQQITYLTNPQQPVHTTIYPNAYGFQWWVSDGDPTPDRRAIMVQ